MSEAVINIDDSIELFDTKILNQVCQGLTHVPSSDEISEIFSYSSEVQFNNDLHRSEKVCSKTTRFPLLLHTILKEDEHPSILSWCLDGNSFAVYDSGKFEKEVMPNYFQTSKWLSFLKQLNVYGFHKTNERDFAVYCHRDFVRNEPSLLNRIIRVKH